MNDIIRTDVPTATFIGNFIMKIRATDIPIPPPTPKNPQKSPIITPIIIDPSNSLFLKNNAHFDVFFFKGFLKKAIPVIRVMIPKPSFNAKSGIYLANKLPIKANVIARKPISEPFFMSILFDFLYMYAEVKDAKTSVSKDKPTAVYAEKLSKIISIPAIKVTAEPPINPVIIPAPNPETSKIRIENSSIFLKFYFKL